MTSRFMVLVETAPRSGKKTAYIGKLIEQMAEDEFPVYETYAKADYLSEAIERVRTLNANKAPTKYWKPVTAD